MSTYVGIDVGSKEHTVYTTDEQKEDPVYQTTVTNDRNSFKQLEKFLSAHSTSSIHLGLEAIGNYWKPLFNHLMDLGDELDITLSLINPNEIHQFKKMVPDSLPTANHRFNPHSLLWGLKRRVFMKVISGLAGGL